MRDHPFWDSYHVHRAIHLTVVFSFIWFLLADIYIWLSGTPAPITGIYLWFAERPFFWDVFHGGLILALFGCALDLWLLGRHARQHVVVFS